VIVDPVGKLLSIGGEALSVAEPVPYLMNGAMKSLGDLLRRVNGFYAFESALHVFASGDVTAPGRSLEEWNDHALWKYAYGDLMSDGLFFAEDVFGIQFVLVDGAVCIFEPDTAKLAPFADDVVGWAGEVLNQYDYVTGHSVAHAWQVENGALLAGHRLIPRVPFALGGKFEAANMVPVEAGRAMRYWGRFARETADLPDGSRFKFSPKLVDSLACLRWNSDEVPECACFSN
jgi:hypothetical protein